MRLKLPSVEYLPAEQALQKDAPGHHIYIYMNGAVTLDDGI